MRIFGKENNQPEMSAQAQDHRTGSAPHVFPPQVFYDPTFNPLYNPLNSFYNRPPEYGYSSNYNEDTKSANGFTSDFHGDFRPLTSMARCPSQQGYEAGPSNHSGNGMHFEM
jgi:hypothetical protein